jgi:hypothetical protein
MTISPTAYPVPLVPKQTEIAMQALTIQLLGLPIPVSPTDPAYSTVRTGWQTLGQPAPKLPLEDVVFVRCTPVDDQYNRGRDVDPLPNDSLTVGQVSTYIRVWETMWSIYGPNSFDNARKIKSGLFTQALHDAFAVLNLNLVLITDPAEFRRVPFELGGEWCERVDFEARFNEQVNEVEIVPSVASADVLVFNEKGLVAEVNQGARLFDDSFLPPRSSFGAAYLPGSGNLMVFDAGGVSYPGGPGLTPVILLNSNLSECSAEIQIPAFDPTISNNSMGIYLRYQGTPTAFTSYYEAFLRPDPAAVVLTKVTSPTSGVTLATQPVTFIPGANLLFKFEAIGPYLNAYLNGALVLRFEDDPPLTSGLTGFITTHGDINRFISTTP